MSCKEHDMAFNKYIKYVRALLAFVMGHFRNDV